MKPYVLITRSLPEASQLMGAFTAWGYECLVEPMSTLELMREHIPPLVESVKQKPQALIFTSRNAVLAVKHVPELFSIPVLCVGDTTAAFAKENGFRQVSSANGNVHDLEQLVQRSCTPGKGRLLYLTGAHIAGHLQENLAKEGFSMERHVLYDTHPVAGFSVKTQEALRQRQVAIALFYSPRTAAIFEQQVIAQELKPYISSVALFCLSRAIAGAFSHLKWREIHYPPVPNTKSLLEIVQKFQFNRLSG